MADIVVAVDDSATTTKGIAVGIPILANDLLNGFAPDPGQVLIEITRYPENGYLVNNNGVIEYTPVDGYEGDDSFEYKLISGPSISGAAPDGVVGTNYLGYSYFVESDDPCEVTLDSGSLPPGVTVNAAGVLNSAPMNPGAAAAYNFALRVTSLVTGLFKIINDSVTIDPLVLALGGVGSSHALLRVPNQIDFDDSYLTVAPYQNIAQLEAGRVIIWGTTTYQYTDDLGATLSAVMSGLGGYVGSRQASIMDDYFIIPGEQTVYRSSNNAASFVPNSIAPTYVWSSVRDGNNIVFNSLSPFSTPGANIYVSQDDGETVALTGTSGVATSGGGSLDAFEGIIICGGRGAGDKPAVSRAAGYSGFLVKLVNDDTALVTKTCSARVNGQARHIIGLSNGKLYWTDQTFNVFTLINIAALGAVRTIVWTGKRFLVGAMGTNYAISIEADMVATQRPCSLGELYDMVVVR